MYRTPDPAASDPLGSAAGAAAPEFPLALKQTAAIAVATASFFKEIALCIRTPKGLISAGMVLLPGQEWHCQMRFGNSHSVLSVYRRKASSLQFRT
jgi:hypothetical protein